MIQQERITVLNDREDRAGRYVLYWMQAAQRAGWNHALEYAIEKANERKVPVVVGFGLTADFPRPTPGTTGSCWKGSGRLRRTWLAGGFVS